jgi:hypothetical protein
MLRFLRFTKGGREKVSPVTVSGVSGEGRTGVTCYGFWGLGGQRKNVTCYGFLCCGIRFACETRFLFLTRKSI